MHRFAVLATVVILHTTPLLAQNNSANVHLNYNMGTAEYFVGRSDTGGFGFNCQDKKQDGYQQRYMIAFTFPATRTAKGDKVAFSRGGEKITLTMDNPEGVSFDGHRNWKSFTRVWSMVRAGDGISVALGSRAPVRLATTGAADVMPTAPCGE